MTPSMRKNLLFAAAVLAVAGALFLLRSHDSGVYAEVTLPDGSTRALPLDEDARYDIPAQDGITVHLVVEDGGIRFADPECPDHRCAGFGVLQNEDDWAACLPAMVSVLVTS